MEKKSSLIVDIFISFLFFVSLFFLFFISLNSQKYTWKDYRILFLPLNANASLILDAAEKEGITGTISIKSLENRFKDIDTALFPASEFTEKDRYAQWFLNDQENIQYMYIPSDKKITAGFFKFLKNNTEFFYIEDTREFSVFQLLAALLFFCIGLFYADRKSIFSTTAFPFIIYAAFQKGVLALVASLLMMYTIAFWTEAVGYYLRFTKEQLFRRLKKNPLLIFLPVVCLLIANFNSRLSLLLFCLAAVCAGTLVYIMEKIRFFVNKKLDAKKIHKKITPYAMSQKSIEKFWDSKKLFKVSAAAVILIIASTFALFFTYNKTMQVYKNTVYLPLPRAAVATAGFTKENFDEAKKLRSGEDLPDLLDFINDKWNLTIMPYINLNNETLNSLSDNNDMVNEEVSISSFSSDSSGTVTEKEPVVLKLNDEFIFNTLSFKHSPVIEDLLQKQERFTSVVYSSKKMPLNKFNFAAFLVALLSSLIPMIIIALRVFEK